MKKAANILLFLLFFQFSFSQEKTDSPKTALLIIDIQEFYFPNGENPGLVNAEQASLNAQQVLNAFRKENAEVIHVQHKADNGFAIHKNVQPADGEKVIVKTFINSFRETDLLSYLKEQSISRLVIVGMQTHLCVEAATRAAADYGFECVLVEDACATRNVNFNGKEVKADKVHTTVLASLNYAGYAKIITVSDFMENPDKYIKEHL